MKSTISLSTSDLNSPKRMSSRPVLLGGGFPEDVSGRVRGVVLAIEGGIDFLAIAWLCCAFFFYSQVSGGAIVACLTMF